MEVVVVGKSSLASRAKVIVCARSHPPTTRRFLFPFGLATQNYKTAKLTIRGELFIWNIFI